jgi:hypothetical protein
MLITKRGQMIIMHIILLQSKTRRSEPRSKSRFVIGVLPIIIVRARAKTISGPSALFFNDDLFAAVCLERGMNDDGYQQQLEQLKIEHRDLDDSIRALSAQTVIDQLQIARLKKKKLTLKDRIRRLEDQLVPDIIA